MRKLYLFNTLALFVLTLWIVPLPAQILDWEYSNILDDIQQSGANPDMEIDDAGNMHISSWRQETNQLAYSFRNGSTGQWSYEVLDANNQSGYKSALVIDENGNIHIAYLLKQGDEAFVKYAHNTQGTWTYEEVLPLESLGKYGPDLDAPIYVQASLDISIQENGQPFISVFDGTVNGEGRCGTQVIYADYDLKLRAIARMTDATWQELSLPAIPYQGTEDCLRTGDRFGEFCKNVQAKNGRTYIFTNSVHNHKLVAFYSDPGDILRWNYSEIDSLDRIGGSIGINQFRETFDFVDVSTPNDSMVHLVYGISDLYGFNNRSSINRRLFFYTRINVDSINSSSYTPFSTSMVVPSDGIQRTGYAISSLDDQNIFMAYYDVNNAALLSRASNNGGQTWRTDTLMKVLTNAPINIETDGDSVFVLVYNGAKDVLHLFSRAVNDRVWVEQAGSIQETRGRTFSSKIVRKSDSRDDIFLAYSESGREQLYYGERIDGTWMHEPVDLDGQEIFEVELWIDNSEQPCMAYTFRETEELRFACKQNEVWTTQVIDGGSNPRDISMTVMDNTVHISYFDLSTGVLKYATATIGSNNWQVVTVDETSPIVGTQSSLHADANGNLHLAYSDIINQRLKYAYKSSGGTWDVSFLTDAFVFQPERMQLLTDSNQEPVIAFRDALANRMMYGTSQNGNWSFEQVKADAINFMGNPLRLILDEKDRAWIVYNFAGVFDELRLLRQDISGSWEDVSVINNVGMIANSFDFHLVEDDFYILGKKNARENKGLAMLFAEGGVTTDIFGGKESENFMSWEVFPNPSNGSFQAKFELETSEKISLELFDLQGKKLFQLVENKTFSAGTHIHQLDVNLPTGIYLLKINSNQNVGIKKLMIKK